MAAQITHMVLADKLFDRFFKNRKRKDFFIGNAFPDIRFLAGIERKKTHFSDLKISNHDSDFLAGMKCHALVDKIREECAQEKGLYSFFAPNKETKRASKFMEDVLLYHQISDWSSVINYFDDVLVEEVEFGISKQDVKEWHTILQQYFSAKPTRTAIQKFCQSIHFSAQTITQIDDFLNEWNVREQLKQSLSNLYDGFESLFSKINPYLPA